MVPRIETEATPLPLTTASSPISFKKAIPYLSAIITVVLWASAFPAIRASLDAYSPVHVALLRYVSASLCLAIYALITRMRLPAWRDIPAFLGLGIIGISFYNVALNTGEVTVPSGVASFIIAAAPVFMALQARFILKEQLRGWGWVGIALSFGGVAIISLLGTQSWSIDWHAILVLTAALAQSIYSIGQKALLRRYSAFECTAYAIWAGALLLLIFAPDVVEQVRAAPISSTMAVLYLGIFPGAVAYVAWSQALARLSASTAASFLYIVPVVAVLIAWVWLQELPMINALIGGVFVLVGVIVVHTWGRGRPA